MEVGQIDVVVEHLDFDVIDDHLRTSTAVLNDIMKREYPSENAASGARDVACSHCGKIYKSQSTLKRHLLLKHANEDSKCSHCEKTYTSQLGLEQHVRYMHRLHRCPVCYRTFDSAEALSAHGDICKKRPIACEVCKNVYPSAVSLRNHVKYKHPHTKAHWCELCRRAFTSDTHLVNHKFSTHPDGATICGCGKSFTSVSALQSHVLYKHTEVNARCHHCHKAFVSRSSLKRHLLKLHLIDMAACSEYKEEIADTVES